MLDLPGGRVLLIDESYNANPTSMRAALALLGQAPMQGRGRRIAVLGDMLELGPEGTTLHAALSDAVVENAIDLVYCAGPLMKSLWDALPSERRGGYADTSASLEPHVLGAVAAGDAVMVKGSLGSRMGPVVKALKRRLRAPARRALVKVRHAVLACRFFRQDFGPQRVPLSHGADRRRDDHGAAVRVPVRAWIIDHLRIRQGKGQPIRADGPASHLMTKRGTPTMGGLMILSAVTVATVLWANRLTLRLDRARRDARVRPGRLLRRYLKVTKQKMADSPVGAAS